MVGTFTFQVLWKRPRVSKGFRWTPSQTHTWNKSNGIMKMFRLVHRIRIVLLLVFTHLPGQKTTIPAQDSLFFLVAFTELTAKGIGKSRVKHNSTLMSRCLCLMHTLHKLVLQQHMKRHQSSREAHWSLYLWYLHTKKSVIMLCLHGNRLLSLVNVFLPSTLLWVILLLFSCCHLFMCQIGASILGFPPPNCADTSSTFCHFLSSWLQPPSLERWSEARAHRLHWHLSFKWLSMHHVTRLSIGH